MTNTTPSSISVELHFLAEHENLSLDFNEAEVALLRLYVRNFERLRATSLLQNGLPDMPSIKWTPETGVRVAAPPVETDEMAAFLHLARPLCLKNEPASFHKMTTMFEDKLVNTWAVAAIHNIVELFKKGHYSPMMSFSIGGVGPSGRLELFSEELLTQWLNGEEYHQDEAKAETVAKLKKLLGDEGAQGIVLAQLGGRVSALHKLYNWVTFVLQGDDGNNSKEAPIQVPFVFDKYGPRLEHQS